MAEVEAWQKALWKFSSVGHIGKVGGPKAWMEPVSPIVATREVRLKLPLPADGRGVTVSLVATDAGDGSGGDLAAWRRPRLVAPGRPEIPLKDLRRVADDLARVRDRLFADTPKYLEASDEVEAAGSRDGVDDRARARGLDPDSLRAWLDYLGIAPTGAVALTGHLVEKRETGGGHAFINGWGLGELPILLANSSDQAVRIPGNMKPHGVAVHPSPTLRAAVGWRSPVAATDPGRGHGHARPPGMRQRRDLDPGTPPRDDPPTGSPRGSPRGIESGRSGRSKGSPWASATSSRWRSARATGATPAT